MKFLKLLIIVLSLSIPIHSYACWENDWDDDDSGWYDDWYDDDDYDDWYDDDWYDDDDYDFSGGMLPEVDVYPDNDWGNDDDWWRTDYDDDYDYDYDDFWEEDEDNAFDSSYSDKSNSTESNNKSEDKQAKSYTLKKSDKLSVDVEVLNDKKGFKQGTSNSCIPAGLEFAAALFGNKEITEGKVLETLVKKYGMGALVGSFTNIPQLAEDLASIARQGGLSSESHVNDIKDAVNHGEVVLTPIAVRENEYHNIVIVGYNESGYIAYDTDKNGDYISVPEDSVNGMYQVGIKK